MGVTLSGPRDRDRAPPRGVDVKETPAGPPGGWGTPRGALGQGLPGPPGSRSRDPGIWASWPGVPLGLRGAPDGLRDRGPGHGQPRRGCFTSTPRGGALSPSRRVPRDPGSGGPWRAPGDRKPHPAERGPESPLFLPGPGYRAPARGVDVKPPPGSLRDPEFWPPFKDFGHFWPKTGKIAR